MIFVLLLLLGLTNGVKIPDGMLLCHRSDPKFSDCVGKGVELGLQVLANGYKPLKIPSIEPFFVENMVINEAPTRAVAVVQNYTNFSIHGIAKSKISNMRMELDEGCGWTMDVLSPQLNLVGDLELKGNILMFQLNSFGRCNMSLTNLHQHHTMQCVKFSKNEKTYVRFSRYSIEAVAEAVHYEFENLFPANREIEKLMKTTINDNAVSLFNDVKKGFEEAFSIYHGEIANLLFSKIPMDEVFLP